MSFQIPQNASSFSNSQREYEDSYWRHKTGHGTDGGAKGGITSKINGLFAEQDELPMYKDKPHFPSRRRKGLLQRKRLLAGLGLICVCFLWWMGILPGSGSASDVRTEKSKESWSWLGKQGGSGTTVDWNERRDAVRDVFMTSWDGYEKYAWGMDEYYPITKKGRNMVEGGMGWIIVDALDTAIMMNLTSRVAKAREWISTSLTYDADHEVNTFETTIRMLGGLLSAHYLSNTYPHLASLREDDVNQPGEDLYIEKATDLADRLLGAYDTPSGVPYASINLNTSVGIPSGLDGGASSTAEAATLQLEMKYLAKLTGEPLYWQKAEKILEVIDAQHSPDGLLPIFIHPATGSFRGENIRLGSRGDSYYEYLIKQYLQTGNTESVYLDMWEEALAGIKKHLITYTKHASLTVLAERQNGLSRPLTPKMDHLVCFLPGTIALGVTGGQTVLEAKARLGTSWTPKHDEDLQLASELMKTCWGMYAVTPSGLAPEISYFHVDSPPRQWEGFTDPTWTPPVSGPLDSSADADWRLDYDIHPQDVHNLQRPETVESLFYMYRITRDPVYREWGWEMFQAFRTHSKVFSDTDGAVYAYTSLDTVMHNPVTEAKKRDNMESFWLAETLKYFYLLFSDDDFFPLHDTVINTEAHFFPRFDTKGSKVFKTGWERSKKPEPIKLEHVPVAAAEQAEDAAAKARAQGKPGDAANADTNTDGETGDKQKQHLLPDDDITHGGIEETGFGKGSAQDDQEDSAESLVENEVAEKNAQPGYEEHVLDMVGAKARMLDLMGAGGGGGQT